MDPCKVICALLCVVLALLVIQLIARPRPRPRPRGSSEMADYDDRYDFALEANGAKIVGTGKTQNYVVPPPSVSWQQYIITTMLGLEFPDARAMIRARTWEGDCWAFKGSKGEATIQLAGTVRITAISMEHIPAHISPTGEISSAPRIIQFEGFKFRKDPHPHDFGSFEYNKEGKPIQYFEVLHPSPKGYNLVRMRVLTNWGHQVYTCVYRVRVHGELETAQSLKKHSMDDEL